MWDIEARMRALVDHPHAWEAADAARILIERLRSISFVRPGATLDAILDNYLAIQERAEACA